MAIFHIYLHFLVVS